MTPEVKERIDQLRHGNVPEGYKKTVLGCIPIQWKTTKCRDVLKDATLGGNYEPCESGLLPLIKMGNIGRGSMDCRKTEYIKDESEADEKDLLKYGDILFNTRNTMELVGKVAIWRDELPVAYFNSNIMRLSFLPKLISTNEYANYLFNLGTVLSQLRRLATGTTSVAAIYRRDLDIVRLALPSLDEQQRIAEILSTQDKVIELKEKLLAERQQQKKYLMQQLLTGKKRIPGFDGEWKSVKLSEVLLERKEKNIDQDHRICSVAVQKGVVDQVEHLGRSYAAADTSNYGVAHYGDIIYTKSPTGDFPYGIIKQSHLSEEVAVSPLYGIYEPVCYEMGYILHTYFSYAINCSNYLLPIIQKGAKNTINITNDVFISKRLYLPMNYEEQKILATIFITADREIDLLRQDIEQEKQKKKALMQLLLTGIVRVKGE